MTPSSGIDADLVLVELAVNDDFTPDHISASETLIRSLLDLPSAPAVLLVDSFALLNARGRPMSLNGGDAHAHLALRYDVPSISLRAAALTAMMANPKLVLPWFNHDERHIAAPMHEMLGGMVSAYLQEEGCRLEKGGYEGEAERWGGDERHAEWPGMQTLGQVPKVSKSRIVCFPPMSRKVELSHFIRRTSSPSPGTPTSPTPPRHPPANLPSPTSPTPPPSARSRHYHHRGPCSRGSSANFTGRPSRPVPSPSGSL